MTYGSESQQAIPIRKIKFKYVAQNVRTAVISHESLITRWPYSISLYIANDCSKKKKKTPGRGLIWKPPPIIVCSFRSVIKVAHPKALNRQFLAFHCRPRPNPCRSWATFELKYEYLRKVHQWQRLLNLMRCTHSRGSAEKRSGNLRKKMRDVSSGPEGRTKDEWRGGRVTHEILTETAPFLSRHFSNFVPK